jgi:hypothetical protein
LVATAEVHFIWRLASEGGMGNNEIMLLDVERDQLLPSYEPKHPGVMASQMQQV